MSPLPELPFAPTLVFLIVLVLLLYFLCKYLWPAWKIHDDMKRACKNLESLQSDAQRFDKNSMGEQFNHSKELEHAWKEYAETLHEQHGEQDGEQCSLQLRATVPAEAFFNTAVLVDTPLGTEFFKHLPGILTGVGIIGTFWGLISGLEHFNVDTDSRALQQNLALLLQGVREAFIASGIAIFAAMLITLIEKGLLNWCYKQTEALLLGLLDQLRNNMENAQQASTTQLNKSLADITNAMAQLMNDLARQREAMNDTGRQSLDNLREGLGLLIEEIRVSSSKTSELYGDELQKLFTQSESRQQELNTQVRGLVEQMQRDQAIRQTAAGNVLEKALSAIQTRIEAADDQNIKRQQARDEETKVLLEQLAGQVINLNTAVSQGTTAMNAAIQRLEAVSVSGANSLTQAASEISEAGTRVGQVLDKVAEVQGQIVQTSHSLSETSGTIRQLLNSYQEQRTQIDNLISTLRGLISDADQRAAMSKELVNEIQHVKDKLQDLLTGLSGHIEQVNNALTKGFDRYADAVTTNMGRVRGEFDQQLKQAVSMISTQIQELEGALDQLVSAINRKNN